MNKQKIITTISFIVMAVSVLVMAGWLWHVPILLSINMLWQPMSFTAAVSFFLSGAISYLFNMRGAGNRKGVMAVVFMLGLFILILKLAFLIFGMFGADYFGIVRFLLRGGQPTLPGEICFMLFALVVLLRSVGIAGFRDIYWVGFAFVLFGFFPVVGFLMRVPRLYYVVPGVSYAASLYGSLLALLLGAGLMLLGIKEYKEFLAAHIENQNAQ